MAFEWVRHAYMGEMGGDARLAWYKENGIDEFFDEIYIDQSTGSGQSSAFAPASATGTDTLVVMPYNGDGDGARAVVCGGYMQNALTASNAPWIGRNGLWNSGKTSVNYNGAEMRRNTLDESASPLYFDIGVVSGTCKVLRITYAQAYAQFLIVRETAPLSDGGGSKVISVVTNNINSNPPYYYDYARNEWMVNGNTAGYQTPTTSNGYLSDTSRYRSINGNIAEKFIIEPLRRFGLVSNYIYSFDGGRNEQIALSQEFTVGGKRWLSLGYGLAVKIS